ncbi:MAG: ROK family protein [Paracoccaceae bacterium]
MDLAGGIDLGGTKIEATIFDADYQPLESNRVVTPRENYPDLLAALVAQTNWLVEKSGRKNLPIGVGIPGRCDPDTGLAFTANLPASGHPLRRDLMAATGSEIQFGNDCDLFTYSEALLGAGQPYKTVFGLVLGTGIGGGTCHQKTLFQTSNGTAGEVGHLPISATLAEKYDLPMITCGCGRSGCYETLGAGPGLARLAQHLTAKQLEPRDIAAQAAAGETDATHIMDVWSSLIAELIGVLQLTIDPDCVVIGGGLSNIPGIAMIISKSLPDAVLRETMPPKVLVAKYGDSSGTRGAALAAKQDLSLQGGQGEPGTSND